MFLLFFTRSILDKMFTWGNSSWTIAERDAMHPLMNLVTSVMNCHIEIDYFNGGRWIHNKKVVTYEGKKEPDDEKVSN